MDICRAPAPRSGEGEARQSVAALNEGVSMGLFHKHASSDAKSADEAASFEVLGADGKIVRYTRGDFDQIFTTVDPDEVQRQVAHGWVILAERQVDGPGTGPSGEDL